MSNQLSTLVSFEWLLPLLNERFRLLQPYWQQLNSSVSLPNSSADTLIVDWSFDDKMFAQMASEYHHLSGVLSLARLYQFAYLAEAISAVLVLLQDQGQIDLDDYATNATNASNTMNADHSINQTQYDNDATTWVVSTNLLALTEHSSQLLHNELNYYAIQGQYRPAVLTSCVTALLRLLPEQSSRLLQQSFASQITDSATTGLSQHIHVPISITNTKKAGQLSQATQLQVLMVWRYQVFQLLSDNDNHSPARVALQRVCQYIYLNMPPSQSDTAHMQALWYVTSVWLQTLADNTQPQPQQYAAILARLEAILSQQHLQPLGEMVSRSELSQQGSELSQQVESILADVYVSMSQLASLSTAAQQLLDLLWVNPEPPIGLFPRSLQQLQLLFTQDLPPVSDVELVLNEIKRQLLQYGWEQYQQPIDGLLDSLAGLVGDDMMQGTYVVVDDDYAAQAQTIQQQLQALYHDLVQTYETISNQIGLLDSSTLNKNDPDEISFATMSLYNVYDTDVVLAEDDTTVDAGLAVQPQALRQVRIAIEDIKQAFQQYLYHNQVSELPTVADFAEIINTFDQAQLVHVNDTVQGLSDLFVSLRDSDQQYLNYQLSDAIAESLVAFELFLDYLAQHAYDQHKLAQANACVEKAQQKLQQSQADVDQPVVADKPDAGVIRYDDSGEHLPASMDTPATASQSVSVDDSDVTDTDAVDIDTTDSDVIDTASTEAMYGDSITITPDTDESQPVIQTGQLTLAGDADVADTNMDVQTDADTDADVATVDNLITDNPALSKARAALKDDDYSMDEEIREIFIEEAGEVLEQMDELLPIWRSDPHNLEPLTDIRRGFHTLKGSGRMVGANNVGEMSWAVENMLNRVLDHSIEVTPELVAFISDTRALIPTLVDDFAQQHPPSIDPAVTVLKASNLLAGQPVNTSLDKLYTTAASDGMDDEVTADSSSDTLLPSSTDIANDQADVDDVSHDLDAIRDLLQPFMDDAANMPSDDSDTDVDIRSIYIEEAYEVLETIIPLFASWREDTDQLDVLIEVRRGFHTLKGSGRMVGANYTGELAWVIENMLNRVLDHTIEATAGLIQLVADVLEGYPQLIDVFEQNGDTYPDEVKLWVASANVYSKHRGDVYDYRLMAPSQLSQPVDPVDTVDNETQQMPEDLVDDGDAIVATQATAVSEDNGVVEDMIADSSIVEDMIADDAAQDVLGHSSAETLSQTEANPDLVQELDHVESKDSQSSTAALQSITAINEQMADAEVSVSPEDEEEQEFVNIFIEEAHERLAVIKAFIDKHETDSRIAVDDEIVRAFHTLRGASGARSLAAISDISATIETSLEVLQQHDAEMNNGHLQALSQSVNLIEGYLQACQDNDEQTSGGTEAISYEQNIEALQEMWDESVESNEAYEPTLTAAALIGDDIDDLLDAQWELELHLFNTSAEQIEVYADVMVSQIQLLLSRVGEAKKFQTLLNALLAVYEYLLMYPEQRVSDALIIALIDGHQQLTLLFDSIAGSMSQRLDEEVIDALYKVVKTDRPQATLEVEAISSDVELMQIFVEEAQELNALCMRTLSGWYDDIDATPPTDELLLYLATLTGGAQLLAIHSVHQLSNDLKVIYEQLAAGELHISKPWIRVLQDAHNVIALQLDYIQREQQSFFVTDVLRQLRRLRLKKELPTDSRLVSTELEQQVIGEVAEEKTVAISSDLPELIETSWQGEYPDPDILEVFLEEAEELVESSGQHLQSFRNNTSDLASLQALQRELHTIKGGARMVSADGVADLAHQMETVYEDLGSRRRPATRLISQLLVTCHDWLASAVFLLKNQLNPPMPTALIEALAGFSNNPDSLQQLPSQSLQEYVTAIEEYQAFDKAARGEVDISDLPAMSLTTSQTQEQSLGSSEMIRISATMMERMINLSGEAAINQARIDMGISSLSSNIEEMGITVQRLADQLRRMDSELEEQILSQIDDDLVTAEGFDPLEMDQYSSLNQLSKSLSESASDLLDIKSTLLEKIRDSENLILQLSRTQAELQDSLMSSRMVPFSRLVPRLQRIVRQTATDLHKSVELVIVNADDEMDRTILDRITSPLEHMLRNAVDHGIESVHERANLGKDRVGRIILEVTREGSEVIIHLTDDGSGIDVESVRQKAIKQGLIDPDDTSLTDTDVMQYIFNAGFTTTKTVTQISGRGVGMDVVRSEVRQLGGVVSVDSKPGRGSRFTIRVPLTVAVSDALVVRAADRYYAIPLVQIERVVRVNPESLYDYYQSGRHTYDIEGIDYRLRYLNEVLSGHALNELTVSTNTSLPVIIIKHQTGQHLAIQVDEIAGSRIELVVKPLGKQLSHVAGISAATIMGDGSVMLILDPLALMRNAPAQVVKPQQVLHSKLPTVMVVDDSVTVRKVTSRFLERQGYESVVAKDGVDAIDMLQEMTPDIILLDIEMPRMDGFEVATQVRHNARLKDIPIIMITSRTGEKHRERAMEIGVNDYVGKPFQEAHLLSRIQMLLDGTTHIQHEE